jgi:flagellar biosynthesis protein FlhA
VEELVPQLLGLGEVQKVLQNLLAERVSIRDLAVILEALADGARITKDTDVLTDYVRQALARQITKNYESEEGVLKAFTLDPDVERLIADGLRQTDVGVQLVVDPSVVQPILEGTREQVERMAAMGNSPVALCSPRVRLHFRRLVEKMNPALAVLSYNELVSGVRLEATGMVSLSDESIKN